MANDKTEKATPKRQEETRNKGQVAKSMDLGGAAVLLAGLMAIGAFGPKMIESMKNCRSRAPAPSPPRSSWPRRWG